ncbi:PucR family transcriptional regulator [Streptomyces yanii]|uniref:PucR family transcriptional regulator n=1 Tax=Streptomyces yanii TaxID=78510 RepID=UPI0031EA90A6
MERITDSFAFHLSVATPGAVAALVGDVCYAIVPAPIRKGKENVTAMAQRISNDFLDRARDRPGGAAIGIGRDGSSSDPADLARSRHDADRTLRVLRQEPAGRVALFADVQLNALLLEIGDQLHNEGGLLDGPIARLHHHDREHGTTMAETVAQWLDHLGNTLNASAAMDVHPNTFRYRLRRAAEIAQLNLNDPDERFAAMLEFRLTRQRPSAAATAVA